MFVDKLIKFFVAFYRVFRAKLGDSVSACLCSYLHLLPLLSKNSRYYTCIAYSYDNNLKSILKEKSCQKNFNHTLMDIILFRIEKRKKRGFFLYEW